MKKSKILGAILSLSMVINTLAVFMPVAQAADSKIISVTDILDEEKAATLKAEWIFKGNNGVQTTPFVDTVAGYQFAAENGTKTVDSNVFGSVVQVSGTDSLLYSTPDDVTDPETGEVTEVVEKPLNMTGKTVSYEAWVNVSNTFQNEHSNGVFIERGGMKATAGMASKFTFEFGGKSKTVDITINKSNSVNGNPNWLHLVMVKDVENGTSNLYVNGESVWAPTDINEATANDNGDIRLGDPKSWPPQPPHRWFASFRIFGAALSATDVKALYKYQGIPLGLVEGDATLTGLTVNGEGIEVVSGTKAYTKTMDSTASVANLGITTKGVATYTCTVKEIVKETVKETDENGEEVEKEVDVEVDVEVDPSSIPLAAGDNEITITITAAGEPEQVYTLNLIRLPMGVSPTRNANLGVLTGKTMVADWYFDVASGTDFIDEINGIKLNQTGVNGALSAARFDNDSVFKTVVISSAGGGTKAGSTGSVTAIDDAKTWSGWVDSSYPAKGDEAANTVWGKAQGRNFGFPSGHKGWILQQVQVVTDGQVNSYYYQIMRGSGSGNHERWRTVNTFENIKSGDWKYITLSFVSDEEGNYNYGTAPLLYINGVKQELTCTQAAGKTGKVDSDAGVGFEIGYTNHSTRAQTRYANLRAFKEAFTEEDIVALYEAEGVAAGIIEIPVKITMSESWGGITATADYSVGNRSDDTVLFIARYNEDGQLEECNFITKELGNEVSIEPGDATDVVKAFVWDSLSTMKPISAVYDNTEL